MVAVPTLVMVPVVANETVSPFTSPVIVPAAVSGVPSYTLLAFGVVTVTVAGLTTISPVTLVILRLAVTSTPAAVCLRPLSLLLSLHLLLLHQTLLSAVYILLGVHLLLLLRHVAVHRM